MREEVLASAGAQLMETSGYELSDLKDIEFFLKNPQVELHAVLRPQIDDPFSLTAFNDLEMGEGGSIGNPFMLDEEKDKEISTPVSEGPTEPPRLLRSRPLGRPIGNVPGSVYWTLFEKLNSLPVHNVIHKIVKSFIKIAIFFQTRQICMR